MEGFQDDDESDTKKDSFVYKFSKRLLDLILSILGLVLLSLGLLIVAILVKLESKGPVIFSQKRMGLNGSLVGPRPSLPNEVANFEPWMLERLSVKPGLTCYWQLEGRNNIDFIEWMKLDLKYVDNRSFLLDLKLIFQTFFVLFGDKNAC